MEAVICTLEWDDENVDCEACCVDSGEDASWQICGCREQETDEGDGSVDPLWNRCIRGSH